MSPCTYYNHYYTHRSVYTDTLYWHNLVASITKEFEDNKKDLIFAIANENYFEADIKVLGLSETSEDVAARKWILGGVRYPMKDEHRRKELEKVHSLTSFTKEKSEPKQKWSKKALIHKVVGTSFENVKLCILDTPDCNTAEGYILWI